MVTGIQEVKDLLKLPLEELIGSLMTHEIMMQDHDQGKDVNKKRSITLKSSVLQESDNEDEEESSENEEDIVMLARKFKSIFRKKNFKKDYKNNKKEDKKKEIICYIFKNLGHMKYDCSKIKDKRKFKKKTMKVIWDDSDESSSDKKNLKVK